MSSFTNEKSELVEVPQGFPTEVRIYPCARPWEELVATQMEGVRHCDACDQMVHEVQDADGLKVAIAAKQCVRIMKRTGGYYLGGVRAAYQPKPTKLTWED